MGDKYRVLHIRPSNGDELLYWLEKMLDEGYIYVASHGEYLVFEKDTQHDN